MAKLIDATLAPYATALNHWPKACGPVVTALELGTIHAMNIRPGKHALANAMYLRPEGATDAQVRAAAVKLDTKGGNQGVLHNYRRQLEADGLMKRDMNAPRGVYKITLTKKGEAQVARYTKATTPKGDQQVAAPVDAAPVKPVKARKPRAARKPRKGDAPVLPAPQGDATVPVDTVPVDVTSAPQGDQPQGDTPQA